MRNFLFATILFAGASLPADAQTRKPAPAAAKHEVVEATKQATKIRGSDHTITMYRFVIVWNDAVPPSGEIFFRNGKEWKETSVSRPERRSFGAAGPNDYMMVEMSLKATDIKPGYRVVINTHRHDHDEEQMPEAVKKMANQGLFYAVTNGKTTTWKVIPVNPKTLPERVQ